MWPSPSGKICWRFGDASTYPAFVVIKVKGIPSTFASFSLSGPLLQAPPPSPNPPSTCPLPADLSHSRVDRRRPRQTPIMLYCLCKLAAVAVALASQVAAVGPTDTYVDADVGQSGYLSNHNMDPAVVDSSAFGQLWTVPFNAKEQVSRRRFWHGGLEQCNGSGYPVLTSMRWCSSTRNPLCTHQMPEAIKSCSWPLHKIGSVL